MKKAKKGIVIKPTRRDLRQEAASLDHMLHHKVFNKYCDACLRGKTKQRPRGIKSLRRIKRIVNTFGDCVTADHVDMSTLGSTGVTGVTDALIMLDVATRFLGVATVADKDTEATEHALRYFLDAHPAKLIYSDNAGNLKKAASNMGMNHEFSLPGVPKSNGLIERYVQVVLQGTRTLLIQAGLPMCFWPYAAECKAFCFNIFGSSIKIDENQVLGKEDRSHTYLDSHKTGRKWLSQSLMTRV